MKQVGLFGDDEEPPMDPEKVKREPRRDVFDAGAGREMRDEAIERVTGTDPAEEWRAQAYPVAAALCRKKRELTTDDFWLALQDAGIPPPPEKRAMTGITASLAAAGLIVNTGTTRRTIRAARHRGYCTVWKSLVAGQ